MSVYEVIFSLQTETYRVLEAKAQALRDRLAGEDEVDPHDARRLEMIELILLRLQAEHGWPQRR